jgi:ArsR family transcriptional regulator
LDPGKSDLGGGAGKGQATHRCSVLRSKHIIVSRKEGHQVFYSIRDARISQMLDLMRSYFQAHLEESMQLLKDEIGDDQLAGVVG